MKILMVLTSHDKLGDTNHKTGFWLEEFAAPFYVFLDAGADITLASPQGGQPPVDPTSNSPEMQTEATRRFEADEESKARMAQTLKLSDINADDFDAVFYPGGHGPLWDLYQDADSIALIKQMYEAKKPVAAVCHAPAVLLNVELDDGPLLAGKEVSGFTNSEEAAVQLTEVVPYLLEDALQAKGGVYKRGEDWAPFVTTAGHLITGQNPASSEPVAKALLEQLG